MPLSRGSHDVGLRERHERSHQSHGHPEGSRQDAFRLRQELLCLVREQADSLIEKADGYSRTPALMCIGRTRGQEEHVAARQKSIHEDVPGRVGQA